MTAAILVAGSQAYKAGFALVEVRFAPPKPISMANRQNSEDGPATLSKSAQEASELAAKAFGPNHWAAHKDLKIRFYDAQRGFWIYAQNYDSNSESGSVIRFWPVVFIWRGAAEPDAKTKNNKLIYGGGDEAVIAMSQSLGVIKPGKEAPKIVRAKLQGSVSIRDDKGTTDALDDLIVGPLAEIEFDEPTLTINSKSDVRIKDRDLLITGQGLRIELWPRELITSPQPNAPKSPNQANFTGTKSIQLASKVRIEVANVGKSNVLPGQARDTTAQIPAWLQCDGPMRIDLPRQSVKPEVGPPRPAEPTIATFTQNVLLQRGKDQPDQLTGDDLRAELFPTTKPPAKAGTEVASDASANASKTGPMTELDLKWARVTGSKVVLKSQAQGLTTIGTELILKRPGYDKADEIYIRGTPQMPLLVERIEYVRDAAKGTEQIRSIETMTARDITLFDEKPKPETHGTATKVAGTAIEVATVVARGAGQVEVRDGRDQPVSRFVKWSEQAVLVTDGEGPTARKVITLAGNSKVWDSKSGTLDSGKSLVLWLAPRGTTTANVNRTDKVVKSGTDKRESEAGQTDKSYEIERVQAVENVKLVADNRFLNAKDRLDVEFLPGTTSNAGLPTNIATKPDVRVKPTTFILADGKAAEAGSNSGSNTENQTAAAATAATPPAQKQPQKVSVDANRIWAKLGPAPATSQNRAAQTGGNKSPIPLGNIELIEARLRGDVKFFQENEDPAKRPAQVDAQAVDIVHQGRGIYHLLAYSVDPNASAAEKAATSMVNVVSDQFELQGPILGLNQLSSTAWVNGPGQIKQWIGSEILKQEGFGNDPKQAATTERKPPAKPGKPQQAVITWKKRMDFLGTPVGADGQPLDARTHFQGGVVVRTKDAWLSADQLDTYFDKRIPLDQMQAAMPGANKSESAGQSAANQAEQKPQISFINAKGKVTIIGRTRKSETEVVQDLYRVEGPHVMYEKARDTVQVAGGGIVRIYQRRDGSQKLPSLGGVGDNKAQAADPNAPQKPFNLTRVEFSEGMQGRIGFDPQAKDNSNKDRSADFFGNVQVLNGQVSDEFRDLNVDNPPPDFKFLSSEWLEVESLADVDNPKVPRNLIRAKGMATARTSSMTTQGDQIHFDSKEELFHVIGMNGREVSLVHQNRPGSAPSIARGSSLVYNNRTGESQLVDPKSIQLIDSNTGSRPRFTPDQKPAPDPKPTRTPLRLPPSSNKERRSF